MPSYAQAGPTRGTKAFKAFPLVQHSTSYLCYFTTHGNRLRISTEPDIVAMTIKDVLQCKDSKEPYTPLSDERLLTSHVSGLVPIIQFAVLHVLASTAILSGSGSVNGHAILRLSPMTCIHELIEHCMYAALFPQDRSAAGSRQNVEEHSFAVKAARICGISASVAITIYLTLSPLVISWTILFSWIYTLRSLALIALPPLTTLQDALSTTEGMRARQQLTTTRALIVHLIACTMIVASDQISLWLVVGGGMMVTMAAFGLNQITQDDAPSLFTLIAGGLLHHLWIAGAFLLPSMGRVDDVGMAVAIFDGALLSVPLSRGRNNIHHAVLFAATTWCIGLMYYGMASS